MEPVPPPAAGPVAPSGAQYAIAAGAYAAVVTESGATLRELTYEGRPVVGGFAADAAASAGRGQILAPWPNRVDSGRYEFDGRAFQLDLSEPARGNAIHGLVRWAGWTPDGESGASVRLVHRLLPRPSYPFLLDLAVTYALDAASGLTVTLTATNRGTAPAPWGTGHHPYLALAGVAAGEVRLRLPAGVYVETDDRGLPVAEHPVDGTAYDFRTARPVAGVALDHPFHELTRGPAGRAVVEVTGPDGAGVALWCDEAYRWLQVFTGGPDDLAGTVAVEPMSCPPNAFATGRDLVRLDPGTTWTGRWGLARIAA